MPLGWVVPLPLMKAVPSCWAKLSRTSSAIHSSMSTAESSSRAEVAAGMAYSSMVGNCISVRAASVGESVSGRAAVSATQPDSAPVMANGLR
jgi:hypothetical protein